MRQAIQVNKLHTFQGHKDAVYTLEPLNGHPSFFSGSGDGMVVRWDLNDPDNGQLVANLANSVYALEYLPEPGVLVIGQNFQGIHLIDVAAGSEIGSLSLTKSAIFDMKQLGNCLLVATGEGIVYLIDIEKLVVLKRIAHSDKSARCISININRGEFAVGYSDHSIRVFELDSCQLKHELQNHSNSVFTIAYHPQKALLVSGGRDACLKVWNLDDNYALQESIVAHMYAINHLDFSPNGQHFVTCSMDKSIKVWDALEFKLLKVIDKNRHAGHGTSVNKLHWSHFKGQLASCSDDRTISIWDLKT